MDETCGVQYLQQPHFSYKHCSDICIHTIIYPRKKLLHNLLDQFCFVLHGGLCSSYRFVIYNIEHNQGLRSMIFYDTKVIPECHSRHSLSLYFLRFPNLIRHHTLFGWFLLAFLASFELFLLPFFYLLESILFLWEYILLFLNI